MARYNKNRILLMIAGIIILGISVGIFRKAEFGTDPYSCLNLGLSKVVGIQYGLIQLITNILLLFVVVVSAKHFIGLGTVVNMVFVGYISDGALFMLTKVVGDTLSLEMRAVLLVAAIIICCIGVSFYMEADLGIAPYDALAFILEKLFKGKLSFKWTRLITDMLCVILGFVMGSIVGVGTVITAFFTGYLITFLRKNLASKFIKPSDTASKSGVKNLRKKPVYMK